MNTSLELVRILEAVGAVASAGFPSHTKLKVSRSEREKCTSVLGTTTGAQSRSGASPPVPPPAKPAPKGSGEDEKHAKWSQGSWSIEWEQSLELLEQGRR